MNRIKIVATDIKSTMSENLSFTKVVLYGGGSIVLYAIFFVVFLLLLDWLNIVTTTASLRSDFSVIRSIAQAGVQFNDIVGVKCIDYFKDILVMVAGVLGVILGLLFTTTISIIATKYSNISTAISSLVLEQYVMNRYFKLLAIMTVASIIFLFVIITGYSPTFISVLIYTLATVFSVAAFIRFGQFSISYFDASRIVSDLISHNVKAMNRLIDNNMRIINNEEYFKSIVQKSNNNIDKIAVIVKESKTSQMSNTSFDEVSERLNDFAISYSRIKYLIPSLDGWHPKLYKHRRWSEISSNDEFYNAYKCNGLSLPHDKLSDYLSVEKRVVDTQFSILEQMPLTEKCLFQIQELGKYLQILAFQCDIELFRYFFDKLECMIKFRFKEIGSNTETHQLSGLYIGLQIEYMIGAYHNIKSLINTERLQKLAHSIHDNVCTECSLPYFVRVWQDNYVKTLRNERKIEGCVKTPLFFTEYKLSSIINERLKEYAIKIADEVYERHNKFNRYLKSVNRDTEAILSCYSALNIYVKVNVLIEQFRSVLNDINSLNYKDSKEYEFDSVLEIKNNNDKFRAQLLDELWDNGIKSIEINDCNLHDIIGDIYHTLNEDITNLAFNDRDKFAFLLRKYSLYTISYMQRVRTELKDASVEYLATKLYPLIVDLFEINSIAIILFRLHEDKELEKSFWSFWDDLFTEQIEAAIFLCTSSIAMYEYSSKVYSIYSHISIQRQQLLTDYILKSDEIEHKHERNSWVHETSYTLKRGDDIYLDPLINNIRDVFGLAKLSDVFIEYYLRTNILLKSNPPKLTQYGQRLKFERENDL